MKRTTLAALLAAAFAAPAFASDPAPIIIMETNKQLLAADAQSDAWKRWADDFSHEMRASMGTMFGPRMSSSKTVKGAPYLADVLTETTQTLSDGNTISRKKTGHIYRDSEGRTRQETVVDGKASSVVIMDAVEGKHIVLTPGAKKAVVVPRAMNFSSDGAKDRQVFSFDGTQIRIEDGKVTVNGESSKTENGRTELTTKAGKKIVVENGKVTIDGKDVASFAASSANPAARVHTRTIESKDSGDGTRREEVRVHVVRSGDDKVAVIPPVPPTPPIAPGGFVPLTPPMPLMPLMPGINTMRFESTAKLGKGITTSLGSRDFDGVKAEGKSTVWTIAAGEIGNKNPINITSETWYSPELQVTVHSRYSDPRTGETVYRLANIKRTEPAADLFKVPEEYKSNKSKEKARG